MESLPEEEIPLSPSEELKAVVEDMIVGTKTADTVNGNEPKQNTSESYSSVPPLIRAIRHGSSSTTDFLQEIKSTGITVTDADRHGRNAFHHAITKPTILKTLLETFKADRSVKDALRHEDKDGEAPIHRAAQFGHRTALEMLHEFDNSQIKLQSKVSKCSVLHYAVRSYSPAAVLFVLNKDPNQIELTDSMSRTAVHYAAKLRQRDVLALLISKGANIMTEDANGQLAIHIAASKGHLNIVELLIQDEPDCIDCFDQTGETPLILAAKNGFHDVVSYLLSKNADYEISDNFGHTAFDWAVELKVNTVIEIFLGKDYWREVVLKSHLGPENCLTKLIENTPETAVMLLDKCITIEGTKADPQNYHIVYDFFCLESAEENEKSPQFQALTCMAENMNEECMSHPVCVKFVNVKWHRRGFKYNLAAIFLALLFHICLMIYTTEIRGVVTKATEIRELNGKNHTRIVVRRLGTRPDADSMMALRVIMLAIVFGTMLKEIIQIFVQRFKYFVRLHHYIQWALCFSVLFYLLPVNQAISARQLGSGSISVILSWTTLIQFLKMLPILGPYILAVHKVFWTLIKVFVVVLIFLLSFATTFYVLLAEHDSFSNIGISIVTSFIAMMNGIDYQTLFVEKGWYPQLFEIKLVVLVLFVLIMSIVVNNTLIGLAVGDTDKVMKSAKSERLRQKILFIVYLERSINALPWFHIPENKCAIEFPKRKRSKYMMYWDFLTLSSMDSVDGEKFDKRTLVSEELETPLEDRFEKILAAKMENLRSNFQQELTEMFEKMEKKWGEDGRG